jgi:hypothetical protein
MKNADAVLNSIISAIDGTDRAAAKAKLGEAAVARNAIISEREKAKSALHLATKHRETHPGKESQAAFEAAESKLAALNLKADKAIAAFDEAEQSLHATLSPAPAPKPAPVAPRDFDDIRRQLNPVHWNPYVNFALHGVTAEMKDTILAETKAAFADYEKVAATILEKHRKQTAVVKEMNAVATKTAGKCYMQHISEMAQVIKADPSAGGNQDGFNMAELETERQSRVAAYKMVLFQLTLEIHEAAKPLLSAGIEAVKKLMEAEIVIEGERLRKFGHPFYAPSEILKSLRAARHLLENRRDVAPEYWTTASATVAGLVALD